MNLANLKRAAALLLCLLFLCPPWTVRQAAADEVYPYDIATLSVSYGLLDANGKELFDSLYAAIRKGESSVRVPSGMTFDEVWQIVLLLDRETPELIAFDAAGTSISYRALTGKDKPVKVDIAYRCTTEEQDRFIETLTYMVSSLAGYDASAGVPAIHDFLCGQIEYDREAYESGDTTDAQRFYDALSTHKGVCNAYAQGFTVLCHFAGYTASYMNGTVGSESGRHAWNIAFVNGCYTYYDVTWDDRDGGDTPLNIYSGAGYERFYRTRQNDPEVPVYAQFPRGVELGTLIRSEDSLSAALVEAASAQTGELVLKFSPEMYAQFNASGDNAYATLARFGIQADSSTAYDDGCAIVFHNCRYNDTVFFSHQSARTPDFSALRKAKTVEFVILTDSATMKEYVSGTTDVLGNALARGGLLPGNYTLYSYHDSNYFKVENAVWKDVTVCTSEDALKSVLKNARKNKSKSLTLVLDLTLYKSLTKNECKSFKSILSDCKVYGSFTYYDSGVMLLSDLHY